jgi:hypothetical protein
MSKPDDLTEDEHRDVNTVQAVARVVGIGQGALEGRGRTAEVAVKRAVVVWILASQHHWTQGRIAHHINRTERQVRRLVQRMR